MAIRLSGSISRKIPIEGVAYSSQSFSCGMDLEISNPSEVQGQLVELYANLNRALDEQVARATAQQHTEIGTTVNAAIAHSQPAPVQSAPPPAQQRNGYATGRNRIAAVNGNGSSRASSNGQPVLISQAQIRAVHAIAKSLNISVTDVLARHNLSEITQVPMRTASLIIDELKALQNGNGAVA